MSDKREGDENVEENAVVRDKKLNRNAGSYPWFQMTMDNVKDRFLEMFAPGT